MKMPTEKLASESVVDGYTLEQSREIANRALDKWIIALAKRMAKEDYEIAIGARKHHRKTILTPEGGTCRWRRENSKQ